MSELDYFQCEVCGVQVMFRESDNETKFPVVRRFQDQDQRKGLLSVRCAECVALPYRLEEGQPNRSSLIGRSDVTVISGSNSTYNYWPRGIGHLLEVFISSPSSQWLDFLKTAPIEIGFLVEEDVNLIVIAYRLGGQDWNVTPYLWHAYPESQRAVPPEHPDSEKFTVATVDTQGGAYRTIRSGELPDEFAAELNGEINKQIRRGKPDGHQYHARATGLWKLLVNNAVDSMLHVRTTI